MSSRRFPGKVLAPLGGVPLILHVVQRAASVVGPEAVTVVTSVERSDDPLVSFLADEGVAVVRGPLNDVLLRFAIALQCRPAEWVFRICADSPLVRPDLMVAMLEQRSTDIELVSNVARRTFPRGHSLELIRSRTLLDLAGRVLGPEDREHVTRALYRGDSRCHTINIECPEPATGAEIETAVDTVGDLMRLEGVLQEFGEAAVAGKPAPPFAAVRVR